MRWTRHTRRSRLIKLDPHLLVILWHEPQFIDLVFPRVLQSHIYAPILALGKDQVSIVDEVRLQPLRRIFHIHLDEYVRRIYLALSLLWGILQPTSANR